MFKSSECSSENTKSVKTFCTYLTIKHAKYSGSHMISTFHCKELKKRALKGESSRDALMSPTGAPYMGIEY